MGLAIMVVGCALPSACARETPAEGRVELQDNGGRSSTAAYETAEEVTVRPVTTMVAEDVATAIAGDMGSVAGGPTIPEYEVQKNGKLVIGGDVLVRCREVGSWEAPPSATRAAKRQILEEQRKQTEVCTKAGFPPDETSR